MNEHQADYNSNYDSDSQQHYDYATEQHLSPVDATGNQDLDFLTQQPESYTQDIYQTGYVDNYNNSFNSDSMEQSNLYSDYHNSLDLNNQFAHTLEPNRFDNSLQTQDYNNNLWENAYQEHSSLSSDGMNSNQDLPKPEPENQHHSDGDKLDKIEKADNSQRSGGMETLNDLSKAHQIGDVITRDDKEYKVVDYAPIHGGYDVIPVEHHPDGTYKEQGSTNTFLPK